MANGDIASELPSTALKSESKVLPSISLDVLAGFADYVVTNHSLQNIFKRAVDIIFDSFQLECVVAAELRSDGQNFILRSTALTSANPEKIEGNYLRRSIMDFLVRDVMVFDEKNSSALKLAADITGDSEMACGVGVTIPGQHRPWGLFLICDKEKRHFSDDDVSFIRAIANLLATAFERNKVEQDRQITMRRVIRAKKQWETTVDALSGIVCLIDNKGHIIRANRSLEEWGICNIVDIEHKDVHRILHPDCEDNSCTFQKSWKRALDKVEKKNQKWEVDDKILNRQLKLSLKKVSSDIDAEIGEDGRSSVLVIEDISGRYSKVEAIRKYKRELETQVHQYRPLLADREDTLAKQLILLTEKDDIDELVSETRKYNYLFDDTLTGVYVIKNGKIIFCNNRFAKIFKYTKEELNGVDFDTLIFMEDRPLVSGGLKLTADYDVMSEDNIIRGMTKDGSMVWLKNILVTAGNDDKLLFNLGNVIDVTEQKRIELSLRKSEKELHVLSSQLINAQEDERKRIACELHDGIGQHLSAIKIEVESCVRMLNEKSLREEVDKLQISIQRIREAIGEVRQISMDLRPSMLDDLGLLVTIEWQCRQFQEVYSSIYVEFDKKMIEEEVPDELKVVVYRILQEALNNIGKYSNASEVLICIEKTRTGIVLSIEDDGMGFVTQLERSIDSKSSGLGIKSMRERAETSGGAFVLESFPEKGVFIKVSWLDSAFGLGV